MMSSRIVAVPFLLGFGYLHLRGEPVRESVFVATAMVATSVGITARVLSDIHALHTREARVILGAAVFDDILGMIVLAVVAGMGAGGGIRWIHMAVLIVEALGFAIFMIFTFTLYFLVYGRDLLEQFTGLFPEPYRAPFLDAMRRIYKMNTGYWYGKFLIGVIAGLTTFVTMKLLGLPYPGGRFIEKLAKEGRKHLLIGGLGFGFTLRRVLELVTTDVKVEVLEDLFCIATEDLR